MLGIIEAPLFEVCLRCRMLQVIFRIWDVKVGNR